MFWGNWESTIMEENLIKKYIKDLNGLLKEIRSWEEKGTIVSETLPNVEPFMYETTIVFIFGRLYNFFNFGNIVFASRKGPPYLDCVVQHNGDPKGLEFEIWSSGFEEHIEKRLVEPKDHKNTIIVCWKHDWKDCPCDIDVIELKHFWELAKNSNQI